MPSLHILPASGSESLVLGQLCCYSWKIVFGISSWILPPYNKGWAMGKADLQTCAFVSSQGMGQEHELESLRKKKTMPFEQMCFFSSWPLKWISICFSKENSCLLGLVGNTNSNKLSIHCPCTCLPVSRQFKDSTRCLLVWFLSQGLVIGGVRN